jgi:hypothetical protein
MINPIITPQHVDYHVKAFKIIRVNAKSKSCFWLRKKGAPAVKGMGLWFAYFVFLLL